MTSLKGIIASLLIIASVGCSDRKNDDTFQANIQNWNEYLTGIIVENIFTPPVSSRIYLYSHLSAYECLRYLENKESLVTKLNGFKQLPEPPNDKVNPELAAFIAFTETGEYLLDDEARMNPLEHNKLTEFRDSLLTNHVNEAGFDESIKYGKYISQLVLQRAMKDGYYERTYPVYQPNQDSGTWKPTPPAFAPAIEPNWNKIKPVVLESAQQFNTNMGNTSFNTERSSSFYREALEVYEVVKNAEPKNIEVAKFWDCNPNIIKGYVGNLKTFYQKISPGGHWISIACIATEKAQLSQAESSRIITLTTAAIFDGFIACWDTKYSTNLIRPETYIKKYIDEEWVPILETPAFPEHTSGHSVVSSAASTVLTGLLGDDFTFVDSSEVDYGLKARRFNSFSEAAEEAAISRLYGGIHYRPAIEKGFEQGRKIGNFVLENLN